LRTLAIINQKGGSGKTTTAINLAAALARRGRRTLIVDMDPQSHCAVGLAVPEESIDLQTGDALLHAGRALDLARLVWTVSRNLDLVPSTTKLAGVEAPRGGLADRDDRESRLGAFLEPLGERYDYCIVDCPPSIGLLTFNALRAANEVLIPVETAYFALQGAAKQISTIRAVSRRYGTNTGFRVVATMHDPDSPLATDVMAELRRKYGTRLAETTIRLDPRLREAASLGIPVQELDPASDGATDYDLLASEIDAGNPLPPRTTEEDESSDLVAVSSTARSAFLRARGGFEPEVTAEEPAAVGAASGGPAPAPLTRAAELAARARRLSARSAEITRRLASDPDLAEAAQVTDAPVVTAAQAPAPEPKPHAIHTVAPLTAHSVGAHDTGDGVLFAHPAPEEVRVFVAGEHNDWSTSATPMRYNPRTGLHEVRLRLPPGRHRYRLVVEGSWIADPYNPQSEPNPFGGKDSIVVVREAPFPAPSTPPARGRAGV